MVSLNKYLKIIDIEAEIVNEDFAVTNISCVNGDDGSIELVVQGGDYSGNFTYEWTGPNGYSATTKNIGNLSDSGTYTVKITQGNCSLIKDFELIEPGKLTATVSNIVHSQCGGDGGFQLDITGGTAPWTVWGYTYGAKGQESITLYYNKLSAGIKNFTVTDANSCSTVNLNPEILGSSKNLQFDVEETVSCDSSVNNEINYNLLKDLSSEAFTPLSYGGGIKSIQHAEKIISLGYEKIILNNLVQSSYCFN